MKTGCFFFSYAGMGVTEGRRRRRLPDAPHGRWLNLFFVFYGSLTEGLNALRLNDALPQGFWRTKNKFFTPAAKAPLTGSLRRLTILHVLGTRAGLAMLDSAVAGCGDFLLVLRTSPGKCVKVLGVGGCCFAQPHFGNARENKASTVRGRWARRARKGSLSSALCRDTIIIESVFKKERLR